MNVCLLFNMADFQQGLVTTVIGFGVVFFVLMVIWAVLVVFGGIMKLLTKNKDIPEKKLPPITAPKANEPVQEIIEEENLVDDGELVAVITAAVAASMDRKVGPDKLVVRSLRRVKKSVWKTEAIHEQQNKVI